MGIYSTNRVAGVVAQEAAVKPEVVSEAEMMNQIIKEIEETAVDPNFAHMMEAAIQIHENDHKMFNALIECDFISAANEHVMLETEAIEANGAANESKFAAIKQKIHELIEKFIELIKKAAQNVTTKIIELTNSDKKLHEKYAKTLTAKNLEGFAGIPNFAYPKGNVLAGIIDKSKSTATFSAFTVKVANAATREEIDGALAEFKTAIENEKSSFEKLSEEFFEAKVDKWIPDGAQISKISNAVQFSNDTIKAVKTLAAKEISKLKEIQKEAKSGKVSFKDRKEAGELQVYKMNKLYEVASKICNTFSKEFSAYTNMAIKQVAAYRKAFIICGRYALAKANGKEVQQEAMTIHMIGESSDLYVFESLCY